MRTVGLTIKKKATAPTKSESKQTKATNTKSESKQKGYTNE